MDLANQREGRRASRQAPLGPATNRRIGQKQSTPGLQGLGIQKAQAMEGGLQAGFAEQGQQGLETRRIGSRQGHGPISGGLGPAAQQGLTGPATTVQHAATGQQIPTGDEGRQNGHGMHSSIQR